MLAACQSVLAARTKSLMEGLKIVDCELTLRIDGAAPSRLSGKPQDLPSPEPTTSCGMYWLRASRYEAKTRCSSALEAAAAVLWANANSTTRLSGKGSAARFVRAENRTSSKRVQTRAGQREASFISSPSKEIDCREWDCK